MGGCQNSGPFLGTLNNRCRIIIGIHKGPIVLTTTHIGLANKTYLRPGSHRDKGWGSRNLNLVSDTKHPSEPYVPQLFDCEIAVTSSWTMPSKSQSFGMAFYLKLKLCKPTLTMFPSWLWSRHPGYYGN